MRGTSFLSLRSLALMPVSSPSSLGIGSTEQSWSDVKAIKNGKQADFGSESLEKRIIYYTSSKLDEAQILRNLDASNNPDHDMFEKMI